ncbi:hypothetical protein SAMN05421831_101262 [Allopseudospirillum japonicum]|uniref:Lipid A deacylase LpxR family protein n=1 Tax=Allopseudospirillum japonicum TaxID=64971 RepID=A0A1H6QL21_9GAMM|nr:lipid A deacylase LpxR family protein [Allopseudospirillum japonicum]SEI39692.1 hypothetical protein SAMN05421831_101262 [Allopseudospirillum japonicum]
MHNSKPILFYCLLLLGTHTSFAQEAQDLQTDEILWNLQLENDMWGKGSDRHYTHGTQIGWMLLDENTPWISELAESLPWWQEQAEYSLEFTLGQNIYTPADIETPELLTQDRPYAGYLYWGASLNNLHPDASKQGRIAERMAIELGMVGPASLADQTQKLVHRIINTRRPRGWHHQLHNEPTANLFYERKWQNFHSLGQYNDLEISPSFDLALGNLHTYAGAGLLVRWGQGVRTDFGPPSIRPGMLGSIYFKPSQTLHWYFFAGMHTRFVARNLLLDGNTWRSSHAVKRKTWIWDAQAGVAVTYHKWRLAFTNIFRGREFVGQTKGDEYGLISLSFYW